MLTLLSPLTLLNPTKPNRYSRPPYSYQYMCTSTLCFKKRHPFYRASYALAVWPCVCVCVCLSVCLSVSVTSRCSAKMAKHRNTQTTPHDSSRTLVLGWHFFRNWKFYQISTYSALARSLSDKWASCLKITTMNNSCCPRPPGIPVREFPGIPGNWGPPKFPAGIPGNFEEQRVNFFD